MVFITALGKTIILPSRSSKAIFWEVQDGLAAESHLEEKDFGYQNYRARRLGAHAVITPGTHALTAARTVRKQLNRIDDLSFRKLDKVILSLSRSPRTADCKNLKWLRPNLWMVRKADYPIVYAIDSRAKQVRLLNVGFRLRYTLRKSSRSR